MKRTQLVRAPTSVPSNCIECCFWCCRHAVFSIHLDLARNRLTEIANGAFEVLLNLTHFDVSYNNKLAKLEAASMEPLLKLQSLNISGNVRMDLHEMRPTLQVSWIRGCVFSTFSFSSFARFPLLRWHALCRCDSLMELRFLAGKIWFPCEIVPGYFKNLFDT